MTLQEKASVILARAYQEALITPVPACSYSSFLDFVLDNNHLTYKYILFTALLSKASDDSINPLCLQKRSSLSGAYDARSICHKVIVPFEIETLEKALGGSNEPFLNKPARFPELSPSNAVRNGNDRAILNALCIYLPSIQTSSDAYQGLIYFLSRLIHIREQKRASLRFSVPDSVNLPSKLLYFIECALQESFEGEILTLLVAGIYHLHFNLPNSLVEVHPVNQCGASGREVSDLDIYVNGDLCLSNELKDKAYSETDVRYAADKVLSAGGNRMLFIEGPQAFAQGDFAHSLQTEYFSHNFTLSIVNYRSFFDLQVSTLPQINCHEFIRFILWSAHENKFKDSSIQYLDNLARSILNLSR